MIRSLPSAKAPFDLVPREMNYRGSAMDIVGRERRIPQRREKRPHLALRKLLPRLDRRLARNRRGEPLVFRRRAGHAVPRQRVERLTQTALGVEARVRHWYRVDDERVPAKSFDLESKALEVLAIGIECFALGGAKMQCQWKQQSLGGCCTALEGVHELLVENALVGGMLIDQHQSLFVLERDVRAPQLKK